MNYENNQFVTKNDLTEALSEVVHKLKDVIISTVRQSEERLAAMIDQKIDEAKSEIKVFTMQGFEAMGRQIDSVEGELFQVSIRLTKVEVTVSRLEKRMDQVDEGVNDINSRLAQMEFEYNQKFKHHAA